MSTELLNQLNFAGGDIEKILQQEPRIKVLEIPGRGVIFSFFHPSGFETRPFLDGGHLPRITKFNTVVISGVFASLRSESPTKMSPVVDIGGEGAWLQLISTVANDEKSYDPRKGRDNRRKYLNAMVAAANRTFEENPFLPHDFIVPIVRCGDNIANRMGIRGLSIEVKRLRFRNLPDLLGAGVNISPEVAPQFVGKRARLLEGVVASGSTEIALMFALRNLGISVDAIDCDAAIVTPAGARLAQEVRYALGITGQDRGTFVGGGLNKDWYVIYGEEDPLLNYLGDGYKNFIGKQVLGDGGDLTSNI